MSTPSMPTPRQRPNSPASGYTLLELIVSMMASFVLFAGLSSSLYIATQTLDDSTSEPLAVLASHNAADQIAQQLQYATRFYEQTATAISFAVPDRDGDDIEEKFRYSWSGVAGEPLTMEFNDSAPATIVPAVKQLDFTYLRKTFAGTTEAVAPLRVQYMGMSEIFLKDKVNSLTLATPNNTDEDDLLIAAVAIRGKNMTDLTAATSGWNLITMDQSDDGVILAVWWKNAVDGESSSSFTWDHNETAYAWMMRFTNHDASNPIHDWEQEKTHSISPSSPAVTSTINHSFILRLGSFRDDEINIGFPGLPGHTVITMKSSIHEEENSEDYKPVSGGAGYRQQALPGSSQASTFTLTKSKASMAVTISIAPEAT